MEKRIEKRLPRSIELMYGCNDTFSPGIALNLSHHGMLIHADCQMVPIDREIKLVLTLNEDVVSMRGVVCWNSEIIGMEPETDKHLGIFIPDPHPDYVSYVDRLD